MQTQQAEPKSSPSDVEFVCDYVRTTVEAAGARFSAEGLEAWNTVWNDSCRAYAKQDGWRDRFEFDQQYFEPKLGEVGESIARATNEDGLDAAGREHVYRGMSFFPDSWFSPYCPPKSHIERIAPELAVAI